MTIHGIPEDPIVSPVAIDRKYKRHSSRPGKQDKRIDIKFYSIKTQPAPGL
jgi:hypothetical protein